MTGTGNLNKRPIISDKILTFVNQVFVEGFTIEDSGLILLLLALSLKARLVENYGGRKRKSTLCLLSLWFGTVGNSLQFLSLVRSAN